MAGAAFFDLDRTLLGGPSGQILARVLREHGVVGGRANPIERAAFGIYEIIGETLPAMALTRAGVRANQGRSRADMQAAAREAVEPLIAAVQPFAHDEIERHRSAGRPVVIATTTPEDLLAPFAAALGVDGLIATKWGHDGTEYDGSVDGRFVWGRGKLASVREWCVEEGVDMQQSWAYSDSWFDAPLLAEVGHPVAVKPDPRLEVLARTLGWPVRHFDAPPGVFKVLGAELQRIVQAAVPAIGRFARFDITGLDHIPDEGSAILVANHRSYFDPLAIGVLSSRTGRMLRFLGKREVFNHPIGGPLASGVGAIPVDRGSGSAEPLNAAIRCLEAGEVVAIMPEGTIPRGPAFFDPVLSGRPGAARLAAATGAPVIPIGIWGTEAVWPRSSSRPNLAIPGFRPTVTMAVGPPVVGLGESEGEDTEAIMRSISVLLPQESRVKVEPTDEQLRSTYPKGRLPGEELTSETPADEAHPSA